MSDTPLSTSPPKEDPPDSVKTENMQSNGSEDKLTTTSPDNKSLEKPHIAKCWACKTQLRSEAVKCHDCGMFQDWRRWTGDIHVPGVVGISAALLGIILGYFQLVDLSAKVADTQTTLGETRKELQSLRDKLDVKAWGYSPDDSEFLLNLSIENLKAHSAEHVVAAIWAERDDREVNGAVDISGPYKVEQSTNDGFDLEIPCPNVTSRSKNGDWIRCSIFALPTNKVIIGVTTLSGLESICGDPIKSIGIKRDDSR